MLNIKEQLTKLKKQYLFNKSLKEFSKFSIASEKRFEVIEKRPMLYDNTLNTDFDKHYIYHPAWAARILKQIKPEKHIDISSTLHFCSIVSAFIPVEFYDFRPPKIAMPNLIVGKADLLSLPFKDNSVASLSCMHTLEHIGLGRYGDKLDYDGDIKAIAELKRALAPNGNLLVVVPIGKPKIVFNAHRIYSKTQILSCFSDLTLHEFALITNENDSTGLLVDASDSVCNGREYGCGCFWFTK